MFAFTFMKVKFDESVNDGFALCAYKIFNHAHHLTGSLLPLYQ